MLVTPSMLRRGGEDPALVCGLRRGRGAGLVQERGLWADPVRVAAAAVVADRILRRTDGLAEAAQYINDLRAVGYRHDPWRLDVMDCVYGSALRPNPCLDRLVDLGVITVSERDGRTWQPGGDGGQSSEISPSGSQPPQ